MLKAVYRKIFLNKIWLQCIFVCFINLFLYKYVCAQNVSKETEELFAFILLGMWGLVFILLFYYLLSGVSQAARFGNWLTQLPPVIRERLEYDFQTGDQIGDLYFTNSTSLYIRSAVECIMGSYAFLMKRFRRFG